MDGGTEGGTDGWRDRGREFYLTTMFKLRPIFSKIIKQETSHKSSGGHGLSRALHQNGDFRNFMANLQNLMQCLNQCSFQRLLK